MAPYLSESHPLEPPDFLDMIPSLLLALPVTLAPAPAAVRPVPFSLQEVDEYETKVTEAGQDVAKLWELQLWCKEQGRNSDARKVLKMIVEIDGTHEEARKALGHHFYDNQWFSSRTELSAYRRAEEKRMLDEKGLVRMGEDWVPIAEAPFIRMGWTKDEESGRYISPGAAARKAEAAKFLEQKYQQQDLTWISPDEFDKWREQLWKCGDDWLDTDQANLYHAKLASPWRVPSQEKHFVVVSTCNRSAVDWSAWWADQTYGDLTRIFGLQPSSAPRVTVVNGVEQYNQMAAGSPDAGIPPSELSGWSSIHYAFFGELLFDASYGTPEYDGGGICYYDEKDPNLQPYGQHAVRHAAALSFIESIDPSWDAVSKMMASAGSGGQPQLGAFWEEKKIPLWMRYGAASYVERYFIDQNAENPNWAFEWSLNNLKTAGGMRPLTELFEFQLDPGNPTGSARWLSECGLVVSFIVNGKNAEVAAAHGAFKQALRSGEPTIATQTGLREALVKNEAAIRKYAGL